MACIVSADTIGVGHITIQNTEFYTALFARAGFRLRTELTDRLREVPVPWAMHPEKEEIVWALYEGTGQPRNGWNRVPGHLFFIRE